MVTICPQSGVYGRPRPYSGVAMATLPRPSAVPPDEPPAPTQASVLRRARGLASAALHLLDPAVLAGNAVESAWLARPRDDLAGRTAGGSR